MDNYSLITGHSLYICMFLKCRLGRMLVPPLTEGTWRKKMRFWTEDNTFRVLNILILRRNIQVERSSSNVIEKFEIWRDAGLEREHLASLILRSHLNQGSWVQA